ncbi:MAG: DNA polymerase III subunit chi [Parasphingopyxis sp.]|nr:DNA polymerase III subunit chi [Sphingomonadales bacterium]
MRVDFYQLGGRPVEEVVPQLAAKVLESGAKLLLVAGEETLRARLDEALWTFEPASFLPHGAAGEDSEACQPILLAENADTAGTDRLTMLADGLWRDAALASERVFYLFGQDRLDDARAAWRGLADRDDAARQYWKQDGGRWREGP